MSAGGRAHAMGLSAELGIAHLVDMAYAKVARGADGRWSMASSAPDHQLDAIVDDWPDEAPVTARLVPVPPYIAPHPHDRGLARLLAELSRGGAVLAATCRILRHREAPRGTACPSQRSPRVAGRVSAR